jgi:hypothetical protein
LEPPDNVAYARRPFAWWKECTSRGVPFKPLLCGESGTFTSWRTLGLNEEAYAAVLGQISDLLASWRAEGMPVLGHCLFALGAEGQMGQLWNLDQAGIDAIATWNHRSDLQDVLGGSVSQAERDRYYADLYHRFNVPLNPNSALYKHWSSLANNGTWLGPPMEAEHQTENGRYVYQSFASNVLTFDTMTGVVTEGLPPLA